MGYPRRLYVPPNSPGVYHCVSRCVRRGHLCGRDPSTGRSFEHRKQWVEGRILELAEIFAVAIHAYAVMSNHYHVVVEIDPTITTGWSDEDVAERWLRLSRHAGGSNLPLDLRVAALVAQPERIAVLRERLGNLSWFMRYLNEPIARRANREDDCTGRFWEGRFVCQALLDDTAILSCMVYVDLNPVRAKIVATPEAGLHTSIRRRARSSLSSNARLRPLASSIDPWDPSISIRQYLALVDWTGRALHVGKRGVIPKELPPILDRLLMLPSQWLVQVPATESHYWRAIGRVDAMLCRAEAAGLKWLRGVGLARALARAQMVY